MGALWWYLECSNIQPLNSVLLPVVRRYFLLICEVVLIIIYLSERKSTVCK